MLSSTNGEYLGVRVTLSESDLLPGETTELILEPLYPELVDYSALSVGTSFELREGPKVVGHGVILAHCLSHLSEIAGRRRLRPAAPG